MGKEDVAYSLQIGPDTTCCWPAATKAASVAWLLVTNPQQTPGRLQLMSWDPALAEVSMWHFCLQAVGQRGMERALCSILAGVSPGWVGQSGPCCPHTALLWVFWASLGVAQAGQPHVEFLSTAWPRAGCKGLSSK